MPSPSPLQRIEEILNEAGVQVDGLAARLAEASPNEELNRRQLMSRTEAAFREGFLMGRRWPKFAPYAADIWRKSDFYARYFARNAGGADAEQRYARYNDLG